ncbi:MAG: hypothetical protein AB1505_29885 [Candidatus Latescibacterota bacterium]
MPTWIIDDGPLDHLAMVVASVDVGVWPKGEYFVADQTARAAGGNRKALLEAAASPFQAFSIMYGSRAFDVLYQHLREPTASDKDLAEHQSIAWAMEERQDAVFVAQDQRAAFLALAELGRSRAAHPTQLWLHLRDQGLVTPEQFRALCERTRRSYQSKIPLRCQH